MEDQTLNPVRASRAVGTVEGRRPEIEEVLPAPVRWFRELPVSAALILLVLIAYWGVWNYSFVYFDDPGYVSENFNVTQGLPLFKNYAVFRNSVYWAFTAFEQSNWHPLTWLSHMLDVQLYGLNAGGHHVTNILFHTSNTLLLFWLLRWITGRTWTSAAVAALFAVHPMHVESVVWVAERKDVLSTFLGLLTLIAYVYYGKQPSIVRFVLVFVLLALGLLAKPMLVTFPCVCLLLDYWPLGRLNFSGQDVPAPERMPPERAAPMRRRAKRNQRLPAAARAQKSVPAVRRTFLQQAAWLVVEKIPLFALSVISAAITPYAQSHGGSMASTSELPLLFRIENSLQSYLTYIARMFWPGKMSVLYLLDVENVNHTYTVIAAAVMLAITGLVVWAALKGRRYLAFGWFWYVGTLVPVIGIVQVGEQTHADRYTYIPYIGLFIMLVWGVADLLCLLPQGRRLFELVAGVALVAVLGICVGWTKYQLQFWTGVEVHLRHALTITPDNWNMLNNLGVYLWKEAQKQDKAAAEAEARGDAAAAAAFREKSKEFKDDAKAQWIHGITARPTATDIHSNLGYAYSEANDLDKAQYHLTEAVRLKPISPRPRNNLGRVLLRRGQQCEVDAKEEEKKGTSEAVVAKVKELRARGKEQQKQAIDQFEEAVRLDPSLLEARLNLGEVYIAINQLDKAEAHFRAIISYRSENVKDQDAISNFSQAWFGISRIALARNNPDGAIAALKEAVTLNPANIASLHQLVLLLFARGDYRDGEMCLRQIMAILPAAGRRAVAEQIGLELDRQGKRREAVRAWNFMAWTFATSPEPHMRDLEEAAKLTQNLLTLTQQQDPLSLDTAAAVHAAFGRFAEASQVAQIAVKLAGSQGNTALADAIARRLQGYQRGVPHTQDPTGADRP